MATTQPPCQFRSKSPARACCMPSTTIVSLILRSPLHRMLSDTLLLLTFTGRRTGKTYTIPVGYTREGGTLTLFTDHAWWRNLRGDGGVPVTVRLAGHPVAGRAEAIPDPAVVAHIAAGLVTRFGAKEAGSRMGLALDDATPPSPDVLAAALRGHVVVQIALEP